jgi:hypothetical protein
MADFACAIIDRFDLFHHDESGDILVTWNRDMEGKSPVFAGDRAYNGETRMLVKRGVAYNQGRSSASLLMAGLRIEGYGNEVALLRDIRRHLPRLPADGFPPVNFLCLIIPWNT